MEYWNDGILGYWIGLKRILDRKFFPSFHYSIIPLFHYSKFDVTEIIHEYNPVLRTWI
jgi:hypothetical protein